MKDIEKRLLRLEQRIRANTMPPPVVVEMRHGEDARLVADVDARTLVYSIVGEMPRAGFATRESVLDALPLAKRWLAFKHRTDDEREAEEGEWRALCELADIDYDAVQADVVPYSPSRHD